MCIPSILKVTGKGLNISSNTWRVAIYTKSPRTRTSSCGGSAMDAGCSFHQHIIPAHTSRVSSLVSPSNPTFRSYLHLPKMRDFVQSSSARTFESHFNDIRISYLQTCNLAMLPRPLSRIIGRHVTTPRSSFAHNNEVAANAT